MKLWQKEGTCRQCRRAFNCTYGVRHIYCSNRCRQLAYRLRRITAWRKRHQLSRDNPGL